jgi:RimJ/RimL family protein N-acetyltransferase
MMPLRSQRLILRNWTDSDRPLFHRINSHDEIMRFFPMRRDRAQSDAMMDLLSQAIERDGFGWTAAQRIDTGDCIGFVGLSIAEIAGILDPGAMEIGWRLVPEAWGKGYATEAAERLAAFAFDELGRDRIYSFAVLENRPSIAVMERLGMTQLADFDHPRVPDSHPHLRRHALYELTANAWRARRLPSD